MRPAGVDLFYNAGVVDAVNNDYASGVFARRWPGFGYDFLTYPITVLITILLISWFVTSSDSGTLVMCTMLSMGDEHPAGQVPDLLGPDLGHRGRGADAGGRV